LADHVVRRLHREAIARADDEISKRPPGLARCIALRLGG
jgi:hypothetical protein